MFWTRREPTKAFDGQLMLFILLWSDKHLTSRGFPTANQSCYVKWDLAGCYLLSLSLSPPTHQCSSTVVYNWTAGRFAKLSSHVKGFTALAAESIFLRLSYLERVAVPTPKIWPVAQHWLGKLKTIDAVNPCGSGGILYVLHTPSPHQGRVSIQRYWSVIRASFHLKPQYPSWTKGNPTIILWAIIMGLIAKGKCLWPFRREKHQLLIQLYCLHWVDLDDGNACSSSLPSVTRMQISCLNFHSNLLSQ